MRSSTADSVATLTAFARALRAGGVPTGSGQVINLCRAADALDPSDRDDLYWAGRLTLVNNPSELATYDRIFGRFFGGGTEAVTADAEIEIEIEIDEAAPAGDAPARPSDRPGHAASDYESLRKRDFADCSPEELDDLRRLVDQFLFATEPVTTRRYQRAIHGERLDLRTTMRDAMRTEGEVLRLRFRRRRTRLRRLVLILDVSGSMSDYSSSLLRFAYAARRGPTPVEVFCFGTEIARVTGELDGRDPGSAIADAAAALFDWQGGTRIAASLATYNRTWGGRTGFRGAVVVVCSDGLEKGNPAALAREVMRLRRRARRLVWVNPRAGHELVQSYPNPSIAAIYPHVDNFTSGHNLASLEELAELLAGVA